MRSAVLMVLFGASCLVQAAMAQDTAAQQGAPADLCRELLAFAEKKASEPPKQAQAQAAAPSGAPAPRADAQSSGTQGGGSVAGGASKDTSAQSSAPTTAPTSSGAAPEAASSPHASDGQNNAKGETQAGAGGAKEAFNFAGDVPFKQVRETVQQADRQACRDLVQKVRRAGGEMPADLLALAAYEPDPAKRK
jgi:hypothetical protein